MRKELCNDYFLSILNPLNDFYFRMKNEKSSVKRMNAYKQCVGFINSEADRFISLGYNSESVNNTKDQQLKYLSDFSKSTLNR